MRARVLSLVLLLLSGQFFAVNAHAFQNGVCRQDVNRYCSNVQLGGGRLTACMYENAPKLEPLCRIEILAAWEQLSTFKKACAKDVARLCGNVAPGHGRVYSCLKMSRGSVSVACKAKL